MRGVSEFVFGILPALIYGCLAIIGVNKIIEGLLPPKYAILPHEPHYALSALLLMWMLAGMVGSVACLVAWAKERKRNTEPNAWLLTGLSAWLLAGLLFLVFVLREMPLVPDASILIPGSCLSSIVVTIGLWIREFRLIRFSYSAGISE
jgi:hypothetical protein